ncbi:hypothetical protein GCM10020254_10090 [Streptomyces goshikiensis]
MGAPAHPPGGPVHAGPRRPVRLVRTAPTADGASVAGGWLVAAAVAVTASTEVARTEAVRTVVAVRTASARTWFPRGLAPAPLAGPVLPTGHDEGARLHGRPPLPVRIIRPRPADGWHNAAP